MKHLLIIAVVLASLVPASANSAETDTLSEYATAFVSWTANRGKFGDMEVITGIDPKKCENVLTFVERRLRESFKRVRIVKSECHSMCIYDDQTHCVTFDKTGRD